METSIAVVLLLVALSLTLAATENHGSSEEEVSTEYGKESRKPGKAAVGQSSHGKNFSLSSRFPIVARTRGFPIDGEIETLPVYAEHGGFPMHAEYPVSAETKRFALPLETKERPVFVGVNHPPVSLGMQESPTSANMNEFHVPVARRVRFSEGTNEPPASVAAGTREFYMHTGKSQLPMFHRTKRFPMPTNINQPLVFRRKKGFPTSLRQEGLLMSPDFPAYPGMKIPPLYTGIKGDKMVKNYLQDFGRYSMSKRTEGFLKTANAETQGSLSTTEVFPMSKGLESVSDGSEGYPTFMGVNGFSQSLDGFPLFEETKRFPVYIGLEDEKKVIKRQSKTGSAELLSETGLGDYMSQTFRGENTNVKIPEYMSKVAQEMYIPVSVGGDFIDSAKTVGMEKIKELLPLVSWMGNFPIEQEMENIKEQLPLVPWMDNFPIEQNIENIKEPLPLVPWTGDFPIEQEMEKIKERFPLVPWMGNFPTEEIDNHPMSVHTLKGPNIPIKMVEKMCLLGSKLGSVLDKARSNCQTDMKDTELVLREGYSLCVMEHLGWLNTDGSINGTALQEDISTVKNKEVKSKLMEVADRCMLQLPLVTEEVERDEKNIMGGANNGEDIHSTDMAAERKEDKQGAKTSENSQLRNNTTETTLETSVTWLADCIMMTVFEECSSFVQRMLDLALEPNKTAT